MFCLLLRSFATPPLLTLFLFIPFFNLNLLLVPSRWWATHVWRLSLRLAGMVSVEKLGVCV